ncbi:hypothetical protein CTT30_14665 [Vibrio coralliilyticus]|nr:hypothetical protein CTT30_14665 [Vibrio coralliilyticus]
MFITFQVLSAFVLGAQILFNICDMSSFVTLLGSTSCVNMFPCESDKAIGYIKAQYWLDKGMIAE